MNQVKPMNQVRENQLKQSLKELDYCIERAKDGVFSISGFCSWHSLEEESDEALEIVSSINKIHKDATSKILKLFGACQKEYRSTGLFVLEESSNAK